MKKFISKVVLEEMKEDIFRLRRENTGLKMKIEVLENSLKEYKLQELLKDVKKELKTVPKDKFVSEYLIGKNQKELIEHLRTTRDEEEIIGILGKFVTVTEVPDEDRFEILLKDISLKEEHDREFEKMMTEKALELENLPY